jgi:hypothetical protein
MPAHITTILRCFDFIASRRIARMRTNFACRQWMSVTTATLVAVLAVGKANAETTPVTTGLVLELRTDAGVTVDGGGLVSSWADQSGLGNSVIQGIAANQPLLVTDVTNGSRTFDVLRFDGDDILTKTAIAGTWPTTTSGGTIFIVHLTSSDVQGNQSFGYGADNSNRFSIGMSALPTNSNFNTRLRPNGAGGASQTSAIPMLPSLNTYYVQSTIWDGTGTDKLFLNLLQSNGSVVSNNSGDVLTSTFATPTTANVGHLGFGNLGISTSTSLVGDIAEILVYNDNLSASDYTAVLNYLGEKYGVIQAGDFDGDRDVDGDDFSIWQANFPTASGAMRGQGDADGDGDVDGADFVVWQTNFPTMLSGSAVIVPEPGSLLLLYLGLIAIPFAKHCSLRGITRNEMHHD